MYRFPPEIMSYIFKPLGRGRATLKTCFLVFSFWLLACMMLLQNAPRIPPYIRESMFSHHSLHSDSPDDQSVVIDDADIKTFTHGFPRLDAPRSRLLISETAGWELRNRHFYGRGLPARFVLHVAFRYLSLTILKRSFSTFIETDHYGGSLSRRSGKDQAGGLTGSSRKLSPVVYWTFD
ncbi:hypothetical protein AB1N83_011833 [Pleurotus pulmonarius]